MITDLVTDGDFSQILRKVTDGDRLKPLLHHVFMANLGVPKRAPPRQ